MKTIGVSAVAAMARGEAIVTAAVSFFSAEPTHVFGGYGVFEMGDDVFHGLGDRALAEVTGGAIGGSEQNVTLTLSGVDPEVAALMDAEDVMGVGVVIYRMIFDGSGRNLLDVRPYKRGRVDEIVVEETIGGTSTITVQVESAARGLGRNNGRMRSDADQRLIDPNDGFFKHTAYAGEKQIYFGGKISSAVRSSF
ncbi:hypothetical protein [Sphingomonas sanxanigenens]|uniref:Phage tail protein n=1 Tax=Sphingomonas sanxanigenens DSM 19645 = NX02 TaxID=1123269 RepID=W0A834_9SPHN|nr:hypothetical protein [Sphingomonas sanxanigenens]AHE52642.1 hypothetical protein NX02_04490 [Sphingomonas sanxanigenens DSM 19645 = NX02]